MEKVWNHPKILNLINFISWMVFGVWFCSLDWTSNYYASWRVKVRPFSFLFSSSATIILECPIHLPNREVSDNVPNGRLTRRIFEIIFRTGAGRGCMQRDDEVTSAWVWEARRNAPWFLFHFHPHLPEHHRGQHFCPPFVSCRSEIAW